MQGRGIRAGRLFGVATNLRQARGFRPHGVPNSKAKGAFNDWFEVFNPGTTAVEMSGMYLTDTLANPA
jgi:hypothetical protein